MIEIERATLGNGNGVVMGPTCTSQQSFAVVRQEDAGDLRR